MELHIERAVEDSVSPTGNADRHSATLLGGFAGHFGPQASAKRATTTAAVIGHCRFSAYFRATFAKMTVTTSDANTMHPIKNPCAKTSVHSAFCSVASEVRLNRLSNRGAETI